MQTRSLSFPVSPRHGRGAFACALLLIAAACTDSPVAPKPEPELPTQNLAKLECRVDVAQGAMSCQSATPPAGVHGDELPLGGQGIYVKLANGAISYDAGTEITSFNVTVQNLLQQAMGTDGVTTTGIKVVVSDPVAVGGIVTVANPDGVSDFLYSNEEYFEYSGALQPYQISAAKTWQFNHPGSVSSFTFQVYVVTPLANTSSIALLDNVWTGAFDSDWDNVLNWVGGVPTSTSTVAIPASTVASPILNMPVLTANVQVADLMVASGSTLGLAGYTLEASGTVDAVGTISGGTVRMTGTGPMPLLRGNVNVVQVTGSVALQGAVKATGAVSVSDGKLNVAGHALSISLP